MQDQTRTSLRESMTPVYKVGVAFVGLEPPPATRFFGIVRVGGIGMAIYRKYPVGGAGHEGLSIYSVDQKGLSRGLPVHIVERSNPPGGLGLEKETEGRSFGICSISSGSLMRRRL
jgi:hypothetical protein